MNHTVTCIISAILLLIPLIVCITLLWRSRDEWYEHNEMPPVAVFMLIACVPLVIGLFAILMTICTP